MSALKNLQANALQERSKSELESDAKDKDGSEEYDPESEPFEGGDPEPDDDYKALAEDLTIATSNISFDKEQVPP